MFDQGVYSMVKDFFVPFRHLRVLVQQLEVAPLEEGQGMSELAVHNVLDQTSVACGILDALKLSNQVQIFLLIEV